MIIKIDGVELAAYPTSFSVTNMDIDNSESSIRAADATLNRDRVGIKRQITMEFGILKTEEISNILRSVKGIFFEMYYLDPEEGDYVTKTFYVGNRTSAVALNTIDGTLWNGLKFTLTER